MPQRVPCALLLWPCTAGISLFTARGPQLHSRWHPVKLHQGQEACASWAHLRVKPFHPPLCLADTVVYTCQQLCHQAQQAATSLPSPGEMAGWGLYSCR